MKKSKILLIMALIVVTLTSVFSGCDFINNNQSQSSVDERYLYYAKFTIQHKIDAQLISEREVIVKRGDYPSIEVPWCKDGGYYFVDYQLYYTGNGEDEKIEDVTVRHNWIYADKPDVYTVEVYIDKMGWHCSFKVEVKDYRVTPTLVIDPAGAIEYTENERYVYKYDGNNHMPKALYCEYNGERIEFSRYSVYALPLLKPVPTSIGFLDVGVYALHFLFSSFHFLLFYPIILGKKQELFLLLASNQNEDEYDFYSGKNRFPTFLPTPYVFDIFQNNTSQTHGKL